MLRYTYTACLVSVLLIQLTCYSYFRASWYNIRKMTNKMQLCAIIYYFLATLHVSSNIFARDREHLNCITASGITHVCRCRLVSWECWHFCWNLSRKLITDRDEGRRRRQWRKEKKEWTRELNKPRICDRHASNLPF